MHLVHSPVVGMMVREESCRKSDRDYFYVVLSCLDGSAAMTTFLFCYARLKSEARTSETLTLFQHIVIGLLELFFHKINLFRAGRE